MIKPERSQVVEIEAGYQFTPEMLLTINGFYIKTKDVIVYKYDRQTGEEFYLNYERTGTSGIEMEYKIRKAWGYTNVGYSFYRASPKSTVDSYQIAGKEHLNISFPAHKLTLNSSFKVWKGMRINPSLVYRSARYAYTQIDENEDGILGRLAPNALANLFVNYEGLFVKGLNVGIGTYDLLDQGTVYPQAYNGGFVRLPGPGREFILKLSYQFSFQPQQ